MLPTSASLDARDEAETSRPEEAEDEAEIEHPDRRDSDPEFVEDVTTAPVPDPGPQPEVLNYCVPPLQAYSWI